MTADEIENYFNVTRLNTSKQLVACLDKDLMDKYKNVPEELRGEQQEVADVNIVKALIDEQDAKQKQIEIQNKIKLLDLELALL